MRFTKPDQGLQPLNGEGADKMYGQSSVKNVFIRGSVVRYVHLPGAAVDTALLEDATRRGRLIICLIDAVNRG